MNIPSEWNQYFNTQGYFVTYYGEIYPGMLFQFPKLTESAFIIPRIRLNHLEGLKRNNELTLDILQEIGLEIKDPLIIRRIIKADNIGSDDDIPPVTVNGVQHCKRMFVFGAGASAYCMPKNEEYRLEEMTFSAPLGNALFGKKFHSIMQNYSGARLSLPQLNRFNNEVEVFLESEWEDIKNTYNPKLLSRHISILYYLQELFISISREMTKDFSDCNIYLSFLDILQKRSVRNPNEKIAFVNFNYDTILDQSITAIFDVGFNKIDDYVNSNKHPFMLFKPHGSSNWGWKFSEGFTRDKGLSGPEWLYDTKASFDEIYFTYLGELDKMVHGRAWAYDNKYTLNKNKIEVISQIPHRHYFPAILIPYRDKDDLVMPYHHRDKLEAVIKEIDELVLIGWKGNEKSFNELLKLNAHNLRKITIVNPDADAVKNSMAPYVNHLESKINFSHFTSFEEFVNSSSL